MLRDAVGAAGKPSCEVLVLTDVSSTLYVGGRFPNDRVCSKVPSRSNSRAVQARERCAGANQKKGRGPSVGFGNVPLVFRVAVAVSQPFMTASAASNSRPEFTREKNSSQLLTLSPNATSARSKTSESLSFVGAGVECCSYALART